LSEKVYQFDLNKEWLDSDAIFGGLSPRAMNWLRVISFAMRSFLSDS